MENIQQRNDKLYLHVKQVQGFSKIDDLEQIFRRTY